MKLVNATDVLIESLGIQEQWVYDIEVEDNHNFYANDILVHNSMYICVEDIMKTKQLNNNVLDNIAIMEKIGSEELKPAIQIACSEVSYLLNAYDESVLDMEQETAADKFVSVADKRYFCRYYKKGKPAFKITGLSLISKSTPTWCKEKLKPVLDIILDEDENTLISYILDTKKEFVEVKPHLVSTISGVNSIDYNYNGEKFQRLNENGKKLSAPIHSRGSIVHNMLLDKFKLKYGKIIPGDKVYYTFLQTPNEAFNQNVVSYVNPNFINDANLLDNVDYEELFQKNFLSSIKLITDRIGWKTDKSVVDMGEWF